MKAQPQRLIDYLWPDGDTLSGAQVYMLLDGARHPAIAQLVRFGKLEYACLYAGQLTPRLQAAAPYLVHMAAASPLSHALLERGWQHNWGVIVVTKAQVTLKQLRLHFKKILRVRDESGTELAFRFYDPRVLRMFLSCCTPDQACQLFGPVSRLIIGPNGTQCALDFSLPHTGAPPVSRHLPILRTEAPLAARKPDGQCLAAHDGADMLTALRPMPLGLHYAQPWFQLQNDPDIVRFTRLPLHADLNAARHWISQQLAKTGKSSMVLTHPDHGVVGAYAINRCDDAGLFYYWVGARYQGRGLGRAALNLLRDQALALGLRRLYSSVFADNHRSVKLMLAAGMQRVPGVTDGGPLQLPCFYWPLASSADELAIPAQHDELRRLLASVGASLAFASESLAQNGIDQSGHLPHATHSAISV